MSKGVNDKHVGPEAMMFVVAPRQLGEIGRSAIDFVAEKITPSDEVKEVFSKLIDKSKETLRLGKEATVNAVYGLVDRSAKKQAAENITQVSS